MRRMRRTRRNRRMYESSDIARLVSKAIKKTEYPRVAKYIDKQIDFEDYISDLIEFDDADDFDSFDADNLVSYGNASDKIVSMFSKEADDYVDAYELYDDDTWSVARGLISYVATDVIITVLRGLGY